MSTSPRVCDGVTTPSFPCDLCGVSEELVLRIIKKAASKLTRPDLEITSIILQRWFNDKSPGQTTKYIPNQDLTSI